LVGAGFRRARRIERLAIHFDEIVVIIIVVIIALVEDRGGGGGGGGGSRDGYGWGNFESELACVTASLAQVVIVTDGNLIIVRVGVRQRDGIVGGDVEALLDDRDEILHAGISSQLEATEISIKLGLDRHSALSGADLGWLLLGFELESHTGLNLRSVNGSL